MFAAVSDAASQNLLLQIPTCSVPASCALRRVHWVKLSREMFNSVLSGWTHDPAALITDTELMALCTTKTGTLGKLILFLRVYKNTMKIISFHVKNWKFVTPNFTLLQQKQHWEDQDFKACGLWPWGFSEVPWSSDVIILCVIISELPEDKIRSKASIVYFKETKPGG